MARDHDPRVLAAIDACAFPAMKSDIARLLLLLLQGGTFVGLKLRCRQPFLDDLAGHRLVLVGHPRLPGPPRPRHLGSELILAAPGEPLIRRALAGCVGNVEARLDTGVWSITGPLVLMRLQDELLPGPHGAFVEGRGVLRESDVYGRLASRSRGAYNAPGRHWYERETRESLYTDCDVRAVRRAGPAARGQPTGPEQPESAQRDFFAAALERTGRAEAVSGTIERRLAIGGAVLGLRFAGEALMRRFLPALAHLEVTSPAPPDAVIHVWDSRTTGVAMADAPVAAGCFTSRGDIWSMGSARFRSAYLWSEHALALFDTVTATGLYWASAPDPMPYWAEASPLRCLLHWWAESRGCQLVHGAAIGDDHGAVLITGPSGAGKSSTALACLEAGMRYLGDDYVLLEPGPAPRVHSLYATAKLDRDQLARFPALAALERDRQGRADGKSVLALHPGRAGQLAASLPLRAILTPRIGGGTQTRLEPITAGELRRAALVTTLAQLPHAGAAARDVIAGLVARLPGLRLSLGRDRAGIAAAIAGLLAGGAPAASPAAGPAPQPGAPLLSVVVPVGGDAAWLAETIESALAQAGPDLDLILVEEPRGPDIEAIVSRLPVEPRRLGQRAIGPAAACNRGIRECAGTLVAILRPGERWSPGGLDAMLEALDSDGGCDVVRGREGPGASPAPALYRRDVFRRAGLLDEDRWLAGSPAWLARAAAAGVRVRQLDRDVLLTRERPAGEAGAPEERRTLRLLKSLIDSSRDMGRSS
ncbi:MAG: glycosyltransferase [Dongiaceae bacterium]